MGRIGPLSAPRFEPAARFTGSQGRVEEPLAGIMGYSALPKIMQQREVEARVMQVKTQGIFPIHTATDRLGCLPIGEPFDILHHHD
jgi:hypothetical protein